MNTPQDFTVRWGGLGEASGSTPVPPEQSEETRHAQAEPSSADAHVEAGLNADLEQVWQDESPLTASHTAVADEVDGELGTRSGHPHHGSADGESHRS